MSSISDSLGVSMAVAIVILALAAIQLAIQIYALIDLARRKQVTGGKRWVWLLVIIFANLIGAILYLAIGRTTPPVSEPVQDAAAAESAAERARSTADLLYGPDGERRQ
ncbi:MAG: PLD nuclease N-terminal domain-containing protein [Thermomicrobiales bacterium]|nr:PLD nuclease N-terminal domain-containing protein [Thermomicrobiales bacterium]